MSEIITVYHLDLDDTRDSVAFSDLDTLTEVVRDRLESLSLNQTLTIRVTQGEMTEAEFDALPEAESE